MSSSKFTDKLREILKTGQAAATTTTTTTTPATPTTINVPTFNPSDLYTNLRSGYASPTINLINALGKILNTALAYSTNGTFDMLKLKSNNFNFDLSQTTGNSKFLLQIAKDYFMYILNNGLAFTKPLTPQQISANMDKILQNPAISSLSDTNPTGPLASKIPTNLKTEITNILNQIKSVNK